METLVYMDEEDKASWFKITELHNEAIKDQNLVPILKQKTSDFWYNMIEKYGVLRNKQLTVNQQAGTICSWVSQGELYRK
jgi:hypothetical protein